MPFKMKTDTLLDNLSTAVILLDEKLVIVEANHAAQAMFERSLNLLLDCPIKQFIADASLDFVRFTQGMQHGEGYSDGDVQISFTDGRHTHADVTVTCLHTADGVTLLLEMRLIEQQKKISQETQQWAQQQAARELIRGLAHEIKNPLGGIRGAAQLLEKELPSADLQEFTTMIIEQSDRLRNLVDRLLGPNSRPNFQNHNVHRVLEKVITLVQLDLSHDIVIERDYDPSIPESIIDQDMVQQAVLNIMRNSVQALMHSGQSDGKINVVTRIERQVTVHGERHPLVMRISLVDNGPGIPSELKDTLFYPMVTGKKEGTGLGLSIAQTLIDHHKGKIDVESWSGHTEFTLYIPINRKELNS
ncbi:nitrogen regulation protein NR(II) [Paraglaciecola agarilytica]|uniref:nitrogen regulation protein NR(II) n=1 Tax=Paraglaciecola chathamensis TaxID=368405 RepID=UPI001C094027|nr:nitrogen regulation protein NR(II) [Paraglaciecola agarilytica]MBU3019268.1 nitrogen regulation protein NR(II) [Paraglaciecola agarilytica]